MKEKRRKRRRLSYILAVVVILFIFAVFYLRTAVAPVVKSVSEGEIRAVTISAVNDAVLDVLKDIPDYTNVVTFHYDSENKVNLMQVNGAIANGIVQKITLKAQENLSIMGMRGISIPLGSLSGFLALSGKGPPVNIKTIPIGSVNATLFSEFEEAGINQTNHRIFIRLDTNVSVVIPGANNVVNTVTDVIIMESVIVGDVPDTYLNSTSTQDMMDLIP